MPRKIRTIVIHRDGKFFPGEIEGALEAVKELSQLGIITADYDCNLIEIKKTSSFLSDFSSNLSMKLPNALVYQIRK